MHSMTPRSHAQTEGAREVSSPTFPGRPHQQARRESWELELLEGAGQDANKHNSNKTFTVAYISQYVTSDVIRLDGCCSNGRALVNDDILCERNDVY